MNSKKTENAAAVEPIVILNILRRVNAGDRLISAPENWFDPINPFVVRFVGKKRGRPLPEKVCCELNRRRLLKVKRVSSGVRELELTKRGMALVG